MAVTDLLLLLRRRWPVVLALLALTAVVAGGVTRVRPVYWSNTDIRLVAPGLKSHSNALVTTTDSVIATAGLVVTEVNASTRTPRLSTDAVTIVDAGVDDGVFVRLPNSGGQWANNFNQPTINVQVSGLDSEDVRRRTSSTVQLVLSTLASRQAAAQVSDKQLITAYPSPAVPVVVLAQGSRVKALAAVSLLGLGLTIGITVFVDQLLLRRRREEHGAARSSSRPRLLTSTGPRT